MKEINYSQFYYLTYLFPHKVSISSYEKRIYFLKYTFLNFTGTFQVESKINSTKIDIYLSLNRKRKGKVVESRNHILNTKF